MNEDFDIFRFLSSPSGAVSEARRKRAHSNKKTDMPAVAWSVSVGFFIGLFGVIISAVILNGLAWVADMEKWFSWLVIAHALAMIVSLVFVLNGFPWMRLVYAALALAQMAFDQTLVTRYFIIVFLIAGILFIIPPANRYFVAATEVRSNRKSPTRR